MAILNRFIGTFRKYVAELGVCDTRGLSIFIVGVMGVVIWDAIIKLSLLGSLYGPDGLTPLKPVLDLCTANLKDNCFIPYSLFSVFDSNAGHIGLLAITIVCASLIAFGYRNFWLFWIVIILQVSFKIRYFINFNGGDLQLTWVLIWTSFLPWAQVNSKKTANTHWSVIIFLVNVVAFYFYAGAAKTGPFWQNGYGVWAALRFDFMRNPGFENMRDIMWLMFSLNYLTLFIETYAAFGLLVPSRFYRFRTGLVSIFIFFHLALGIAMNSFSMPQLGILTWLVFLPPKYFDWFERPFLKKFFQFFSTKSVSTEKTYHFFLSLFLCCFCLLTGSGNIAKIYGESKTVRDLGVLSFGLGIAPLWQYYAPDTPHYTGWIVLVGKNKEGDLLQVDVVDNTISRSLHLEKPAAGTSIYRNRNWSKTFYNMTTPHPFLPPALIIPPICRRFPELESLEVIFFMELLDPAISIEPKRLVLASQTCQR